MTPHAVYGTFPAHCEAPSDDDHAESDGHEQAYPSASDVSLLSRLFFLWFEPLVEIASRRQVRVSDIWSLGVEHRCQHAYEEFLAVYKTSSSLIWSIMRCYWQYFVKSGVLSCLSILLSILHPMLLYIVIRIAMSAQHGDEVVVTMVLLVCILIGNIGSIALKRHSVRVLLLASTKAIGAIETLLFDRAISIPPRTGHDKDNEGMTSSDASFLFHELSKIYHAITIIHTPWIYTIHISANLFMLYAIIGDAFVVSIMSAVVAQVVALLLTTWDAKCSHKWTHSRAKRIQVVSESVKTIQTIKLHAWESRLLDRIQSLRDEEVDDATQYLAASVVTRSVLSVLPEIIMIFTFAGLTNSEKGLSDFDPATVFATIAIVSRLHMTFTMFITHIQDMARSYFFILHLEKALRRHSERHEKCTKRCERTLTPSSTPFILNPNVIVHVVNAMIARTLDEPILVSTNLLVRKGELVVIHGKVGSGKSTFLRALVGDALQLNRRGNVEVKGRIAYCSETPWLQTRSIRDNILFGEQYDENKYLNVLHACCLLRDLAAFPAGDKTIVGPKGLNISGGQKARICLARACYADADVYLLDSPLSSVDAIVQHDIFSRCFLNLLKHKTVILVTHNMEVITSPFVDQVVRIEDHQFIHETDLGRSFRASPSLSYRPRRTIIPKKIPGSRERGERSCVAPRECSTFRGLELTQYQGTQIEAKWRAIALKFDLQTTTDENHPFLHPDVVNQYLELCGSGWVLVPLCLTVVLARISLVAGDIWVCVWSKEVAQYNDEGTNAAVQETAQVRQTNVVVYATLIVGAAAMTFYGSVVTMISCKEAANSLFSRMMNGVLFAPMSFFYSRPIGEIVNRFNGDIAHLDTKMQELVFQSASAAAGAIVPWLVLLILIPEMILVLPAVVYLVKRNRHHLRVALEMLRHTVSSLSPCYNSIEEYVEGRRVILAFGWTHVDRFRRRHQRQLDRMLKVQFANAMFESWSVLQFMKLDMLLISVLIFAPFGRDMDPVVLGLALNYIFLMNGQLFSWCGSVLALGSSFLNVNRVIDYADTPAENVDTIGQLIDVAPHWPSRGDIEFRRVCFQYTKCGGPILKEVSLHILPGENIGVVGRTGAGKSSLTMALFRIHELAAGQIVIDGVDISTIDLYTLRSRLAIVPQSPLFFKGTLRSYLDPFEDVDDVMLWEALRKTGLGEAVSRMEGKLSAELHENAENLSLGEQQLLCLSRVLLKQSKVVVLDEATAAVDPAMDERLQLVLQRELYDATVISIAHRLDSILEFNRVVVMEEGCVVQCGSVEELVSDANGPFFHLLEGALLKM